MIDIEGMSIGNDQPIAIIAGPCVVESYDICAAVACELADIRADRQIPVIFKSSFDKANRTSHESYRGPGPIEGLEILRRISEDFSLPVLTDIHEREQIADAADVASVVQIPAFLCRQTDFILAAASQGVPLNIKKGQWMAPEDMGPVIDKCASVGNDRIMLCERGTAFGYRNLVVDMRGLEIMRALERPVVFDCTHSVQRPGGLGNSSDGDRGFAPVLARAAATVGIAALFAETHPDPDSALSDGPNMIPLDQLADLVATVQSIDALIKG